LTRLAACRLTRNEICDTMSTNDLQDLRRRVVELERKEQIRQKKDQRQKKFIDITRQAIIKLLGAIEDWGNIVRTIPPRRDRRK